LAPRAGDRTRVAAGTVSGSRAGLICIMDRCNRPCFQAQKPSQAEQSIISNCLLPQHRAI
jgi:hypothetical protein